MNRRLTGMNTWRNFYSPIGPLYMLPRGVPHSTLCLEEKLFYICATSLCHGVNPVTKQYTKWKMTTIWEAAYYRENSYQAHIPLDTVQSCQIVEVVCHCHTHPECPMLQCSACQELYHEQREVSWSLSVTTKQRNGNAEHAKTAKSNFTLHSCPVGFSLTSILKFPLMQLVLYSS